MPPLSDTMAATEPLTSPPSISKSHELVMQDAVATDAEAIAKIGAAIFAASFGHSVPAEHLQAYLDEAYTPTAISRDMANRQSQFFVARLRSTSAAETGEVVGFIQMKLGTTEPCLPPDALMCELHRIYVSPHYHGGGIG